MNNSLLHEFESGQVTHLGLPFGRTHVGPGFAIPLVTSRGGANTQYLQRVNASRKIIGFDLFDDVTRRLSLADSHEVHLGGDEVYAVVDPEGNPLAGTQRELIPLVQNWVREIKWPLLRMSFARFCGQDDLAEKSARAAVQEKTVELRDREHAILWFIDSVVMAELLSMLAQARGSRAANVPDDIFSRYTLSVVRRNRELVIELPANLLGLTTLLNKRENLQLKKLLELARRATGTPLDLEAASAEAANAMHAPSFKLHDRADGLTSRLASLPRQETRLATIIEAILTDRPAGLLVLDQYKDPAKFTLTATENLRRALKQPIHEEDLERTISLTLRRAIRDAFPMQKARLLLELAKVLGRFPSLASIIREATVRSKALQVELLRDEILGHLGSDN